MLPDLVRGLIPRDILLLARLLAASGALLWVALGGPALMPLVSAAVPFLLITSALIWRADLRRGHPASLSEVPAYAVPGLLPPSAGCMAPSAPTDPNLALLGVLAVRAPRL